MQKDLNFTFNHKDQSDRLYEILTSKQIKEAFDSRGEDLRDFIYKVIDTLKSTTEDSGAKNIGISNSEDFNADNVQDALMQIKKEIVNVVLGQIPTATIEDRSLSNKPGQVKDQVMQLKKDLQQTNLQLSGVQDNKLETFKTDVSLTNLKDCNGGFVECKEVRGNTEVNLSKFNTVITLVDRLKVETNVTSREKITIVNNTNKKLYVGISENGVYKRSINASKQLTLITLSNNETLYSCEGLFTDGWTEANKNDLLKVMVLDGEVKTPVNYYFEGMKSVGELVTLQAKIDTIITSKQFVDIEVLNTYDLKVNEYVKWVDVNGATVKDNIKITNIVENVLSLDLGSMFGTGVIKTTEKLMPKINRYRIEILSKGKNLFDGELEKGAFDLQGNTVTNDNCIRSKNFIPVIGASNITISSDKNYVFYLVAYDKNKNFIINFGNKGVCPLNCSYIKIRSDAGLIQNDLATKIQVEHGINGSSYELYKENKTEILLPRGLDRFSNINATGQVTWGGKDYVLNGNINEKWSVSNSKQNTQNFYITLPDIKSNVGLNYKDGVVSPFLSTETYNNFKNNDVECISLNNTISQIMLISISKSKLGMLDSDSDETKIQKLKKYLENNNIPFIYELADNVKITQNLNKTLNLRAYDNLIVNAGAIQPQVSYSYAKNTGGRITSIENKIATLGDTSSIEKNLKEIIKEIDKKTDNKIGDTSTLATKDKSNITSAINELFQSANSSLQSVNNGKNLIAGVVGNVSGQNSFQEITSYIENKRNEIGRYLGAGDYPNLQRLCDWTSQRKTDLANQLVAKSVGASNQEDLGQLINKVSQIQTRSKTAEGTTTIQLENKNPSVDKFTINNLDFKPADLSLNLEKIPFRYSNQKQELRSVEFFQGVGGVKTFRLLDASTNEIVKITVSTELVGNSVNVEFNFSVNKNVDAWFYNSEIKIKWTAIE